MVDLDWMDSVSTCSSVTRTANYIAAARALETEYSEGIIRDEWAREFAGEDGFLMLDYFARYRPRAIWTENQPPEDLTAIIIAIRTKFIDEHLIHFCTEKQINQVVILGCGFDTRSCRLPWPNPQQTFVFEVDFQPIIERRNQVLGDSASNLEYARRKSIVCDVTNVDELSSRLLESGFDKQKKTIWVLEGLLTYFEASQVHNLMHLISKLSCQDSVIIGDVHNQASLNSPFTQNYNQAWAREGAPLKWGTTYPESFLDWHGFSCVQCCRYGEPGADFGRYPPSIKWMLERFPRSNPDSPATYLFVGIRDERGVESLNQWEMVLSLEAASSQLKELQGWIQPNRCDKIQEFLQDYTKRFLTPTSLIGAPKEDEPTKCDTDDLELELPSEDLD